MIEFRMKGIKLEAMSNNSNFTWLNKISNCAHFNVSIRNFFNEY